MEGKSALEGVNETERRKKEARSLAMSNPGRPRCQRYGDGGCGVAYTIWAKECGTDGIEAGEQEEEEGAPLVLLIYCHYEAALVSFCYCDTAASDMRHAALRSQCFST